MFQRTATPKYTELKLQDKAKPSKLASGIYKMQVHKISIIVKVCTMVQRTNRQKPGV